MNRDDEIYFDDEAPDWVAYTGGLARGVEGVRSQPVDLQRLATRVGCFEALLDDRRVIEFLDRWDAPGHDPAELDQLRDEETERKLLAEARRFVDTVGLPVRWLAEELVRERARRLRARLFQADGIKGAPRITGAVLNELLAEAREGGDTPPSAVNVRVEVHRHENEGNAAFLERVDAALGSAKLRSGYFRLASWAVDAPDGRPARHAHGLSEGRARLAGRAYYLAKLRSPVLRGAALRSELLGADAPTVSKMIAEAGDRLEDTPPT